MEVGRSAPVWFLIDPRMAMDIMESIPKSSKLSVSFNSLLSIPVSSDMAAMNASITSASSEECTLVAEDILPSSWLSSSEEFELVSPALGRGLCDP